MENGGQTAAFKRIVKKEPKYVSDYPFRGVVKLGSQEFAFALDAVPPKPEGRRNQGQGREDEESPRPTRRPASWPTSCSRRRPRPKHRRREGDAYNRLYFDFNHNGDLTDDKVIEANRAANFGSRDRRARQSYASFQFPRVDLDDRRRGNQAGLFLLPARTT